MKEGSKNVIIFSKSSYETSTENVMDWIWHLGHKVTRINGDDFELYLDQTNTIKLEGDDLVVNGLTYDKYHSIWLRRWSDYSIISSIVENLQSEPTLLVRSLVSSVSQDLYTTEGIIVGHANSPKFLSPPTKVETNKLLNLLQAKKSGLRIPKFILTTDKKILKDFFHTCKGKVVIKDLNNSFRYTDSEALWQTYTVLIGNDEYESLPEKFYLTLFQEYIEKEYEIRCFILEDRCYSMAIFSQGDAQTQVDFRRYNFEHPNRNVPYQLPELIEQKLFKLMRTLQLQTGSIDLIKSIDDEYYFLEVNPVGQYGLMSDQCNYNLDEEIANYLVS